MRRRWPWILRYGSAWRASPRGCPSDRHGRHDSVATARPSSPRRARAVMSLLWCVSARECPRSDAVPRPGRAIGRDLSGHSGSPAEPDWPKCPSMRSKGPGIRLALVVERRRRATQEGGAMPNATIDTDRIRIGPRFAVTLHRTLRIPDDDRVYPLPPGLGTFPVRRVADYRDRVPPEWPSGGAFIAMYQREALWIGFHGASWKPNAVMVAVGRINALTGERDGPELRRSPELPRDAAPAVARRHQDQSRLRPAIRGHAARPGLHGRGRAVRGGAPRGDPS